jgi:hypothetical protein
MTTRGNFALPRKRTLCRRDACRQRENDPFDSRAKTVRATGSVAHGLAVGRYFRRRAEAARDILFEELRRANISDAQAVSEDDAIAVIVRYLRAAREGALG